MRDFLRRLFSDESGNPSSNRVVGSIVILVGLVLACTGNKDGAVVVLSAGSALMGVGQIKSAIVSSTTAKPAAPTTTATPTPTPADKVAPKD